MELEPISEKIPIDIVILRGKSTQDKMTTHVSFTQAINNATGLFVAESFVEVKENIPDTSISIFSDDPYCLYVNNKLVKKQGGKGLENWVDPSWGTPRCYQQDAIDGVEGNVSFKSGWNRFLLFQQVSPNSSGITFVFPELADESLKFVKQTSSFGLPGWNLSGPLQLPFSNIAGSLSLNGLRQISYYKIQPFDIAVHLQAYHYEIEEDQEESVESIELENGQFVILQLEKYERGFLELTAIGCGGDTIDIIYGDYLVHDVLPSVNQGVRKIFSLTLPDREAKWQAVAPHGMEYVMILVRQAAGNVHIRNIGLRKTSFSMKDQNSFTCSDELLNQLWEYGVNTLNSTYDYVFLNSGENPEGQKLADTMIQSISSYFIYGTSKFSEKALREFAQAQFETGEIPAITPSDLNVRYFDFCLLWPIWLQQHVYYTGDQKILDDLLPTLEAVLSFFDGLSSVNSKLLDNDTLNSAGDLPYLIDYDQNLERKGISTALNALYCCSLLKAEWLFLLTENEEKAEECNKRASQIAMQLRELTWDEEKGLFADCWYDGKASSVHSMQTNIFALFAGIPAEKQSSRMLENLLIEYAPLPRNNH